MRRIHIPLSICLLLAAGCRQEMAEQPSYKPLEPSRFFVDGQSARQSVPGTVPRGELEDDPHFFDGVKPSAGATTPLPPEGPSLEAADQYADEFPIPLTPGVVRHGQERFNIYCAPCHDRRGTGLGEVVRHGFPRAASYHTARLRAAPAGYLFDVMTRGYKKMPPYGMRIEPADRWAIVAYIRALQLSRYAELDSLPPEIGERFAADERAAP